MTMLFDTHTHLTHKRFTADRDQLIAALPAQGVGRIMEICCSLADHPRAAALAGKFPFISVAAGIHPNRAAAA